MGVLAIIYDIVTGKIVYHQQVFDEKFFYIEPKTGEKLIFIKANRDNVDMVNSFTDFKLLRIEEYEDENKQVQVRLVLNEELLSRFPLPQNYNQKSNGDDVVEA